ncbi:hypothetical protein TNCV_177501 [Trichonephila clavipes]|nr:hypothetical protein TNCV_177501 [Trichonephila clavipes]
MQHIRSRCERVRLPDTRGVMMVYPPPKRCLTTPSRGLKDFSHFFRKCKICGRKVTGGRKLLQESYVGNYGNLYITDAYLGGRMNTPFAAKVHAATLARRNTMTVGVAPL